MTWKAAAQRRLNKATRGVIDTAEALAALDRYGWALMHAPFDSAEAFREDLQTIAEMFGDAVPPSRWQLIDTLCPSTISRAKPTSLSGKFGLGEFPLHCDTAFWPVPCRHILLACEEPGEADVSTVLLDTTTVKLTPAEKDLATNALFFIRNGRQSFYSTILSPHRQFVRIDPGCFEPTDDAGRLALGLFGSERWDTHLVRISWTKGDILLVNNWRVLHGREAFGDIGGQRRLTRILIR